MPGLAFTHPALLWGLFASALPLILHLINRTRARRRPFAALDFLLRVQRRSARRILLRQVLLLVARTLLIAALVLAAAGPVHRPLRTTAQPGGTSTVLILDRSLSMRAVIGERSLFAAAREKGLEAARSLGPQDRMCFVVAGTTTETRVQPCTGSGSLVQAALEETAPAFGRSDLSSAMETAAALLQQAPGPNRRILLLSDGAAHAFPSPPRWPAGTPPPEVVLADLDGSGPRDNHALQQVELRPTGRRVELGARLQSFSSVIESAVPLEVRLGGESVARGFVDLPPGESTRKVFNVSLPSSPQVSGSLELKPDRLTEDDQLPFLLSGSAGASVLLINGDLQSVLYLDELFYAERALAPSGEEASGITLLSTTPDAFREAQLSGVQVAALLNVRELKAEAASTLRRFVGAGGGLLIALGDQVDVDRSNAQLGDLLPWALRDVVSLGPAGPDSVQHTGIAFAGADATHPLFASFGEPETAALAAVRTWRAVVLEPGRAAPGTRVLLRFENDAPALVEGRVGQGRVVLFTSSLDRDWTNWPARASFVPFLQRLCFYLAGRLSRAAPPEVEVDAPVRFPIPEGADEVRITLPDERRVSLPPQDLAKGQATFRDTAVPGLYRVEALAAGQPIEGEGAPGFLVRLPPTESDLRPLPADRLQELLGEGAVLTLAGDGAQRSSVLTFLLLALALLLCEAILVRR